MVNNTEPIFITNDPPEYKGMDFEFLRQEGIKHIQKLAGKVWTDHNTHDPGITILDQLCFAITDLSNRINYDIKDLLSDKHGDPYKSLFTPAEILTVNPVTALDIRKVVLDVEGVKNAWIEKTSRSNPDIYYDTESRSLNLSDEGEGFEPLEIAGLYRVLIEKSESTAHASEILPNVTSRLNACRNLCEDFSEIKILSPQLITVSGNIEVGKVEDLNTFAANILFRVASFISPQIKFYTLEELLNKGKRIDEIFEGPVLSHGFIDDNELRKYDRKTELYTSDVIRELMDEPEVIAVNQVGVSITTLTAGVTDNATADDVRLKQNWRLILDKEKVPKLDLLNSLQNIRFLKAGAELTVDPLKVESVFNKLRDADLYFPLSENERNIIPEPGVFRNVNKYYSIQNHFQQAYGIGEVGLPASSPVKRIAQAKQLKAYLMFFEQVLANYFQQVNSARELFSFYNNDVRSYFSQSLEDLVPGAEEIIKNIDEHETRLAELTESSAAGAERKNRFLNHLLARFSESLTDYSLWLYDQAISAKPNVKNEWVQASVSTSKKLIDDKLSFLRNYPAMSNDRGKAFNYRMKSWDSDNISGLEKRIAGKLGVLNYKRRKLADNNGEGFHMLEHILLRPIPEDFTSLIKYLVPKYITKFEKADADNVRCTCEHHGLQNGEQISIRGSNGYDGVFTVHEVIADTFQVNAKYAGPGNADKQGGELKPNFVRTDVNTRILLLTKPIAEFAASRFNNKATVKCSSPVHGLTEGEAVEIIGTINYNGSYNILNVTADTFDIPVKFIEPEAGGRWLNQYQKKDPYSLQLTFIFPERPEPERANDRFQNSNFRSFIESTIREQTPVHLTVYIRWLNREELGKFETAFENFLDQLSNTES